MKLNELIHVAEGISIAVAPDAEGAEGVWQIYILNYLNTPIRNVLIQSSGIGEIDAWPTKTSTLRHFFDRMEPHSYYAVESIVEEVFLLENKYWVSYYIDEKVYDKKFVFAANSIAEKHCAPIELLGKKGIEVK